MLLPLSIQVGKRIIDESADWSVEEAFTRRRELAAPALSSRDAGEGVPAFAQKRLRSGRAGETRTPRAGITQLHPLA